MNVIGDLLSCAMGYNFARFFGTVLDFKVFPLVVYLIIESSLLVAIRDNMGLIILQLFKPSDR